MGTNKLKIFYYPTYNVDQQTANIYEFSDFSAAHCLNKSTNNLNLEILKSIHGDIKKYFGNFYLKFLLKLFLVRGERRGKEKRQFN